MLKLPVCPYCGAVYYYKDVKKTVKRETALCHHCRLRFGVRARVPRAVLLFFTALLMVALDVLFLWVFPTINLLALYLVTLCLLAAGFLLIPYVVRFVPLEKKNRK